MIEKQKPNEVIYSSVLQLIITKNQSKNLFLAHPVFSLIYIVDLLLLHTSCGGYGVLYRKD